MNFLSDNAYGAAPEILAALAQANTGPAAPYGEDDITARVQQRFAEIFEHEVAVFPVVTGTAANALALATLVPPYGAIFCHAHSHLVVDECAAPEFFTGGARLVPIAGAHAKLTPDAVQRALAAYRGGVHSPKPSAISITEASERGTVYTAKEIAALGELARAEGMALHMDGARFANALAHLGCAPADIAWRAGVDALSFGASKNGALCAEAVIFFDPARAGDVEYRRKRSGHLLSKMRFVSAQLEAHLAKDRWLRQARTANALAQRLAAGLAEIADVQIAEPVEANEVFADMPDPLARKLREAGAQFYEWEKRENSRTLIRLVLSFLTPAEEVNEFLHLARS
jgi:threonine aldolase